MSWGVSAVIGQHAASRELLCFYLGQDEPVLHFGLGEAESVDLVVRFLDGTRVVRENVRAGQTILVDGRG